MTSIFVDFLVALINHKVTPWVLSGLILLFAYVMYSVFVKKLELIFQAIGEARAQIKAYKAGEIDFDALSAHFGNSPFLRAPWQALEKSFLVETDELDGSKLIIAPTNVGEHFNDHSILSPSINLRFYQGLPNILVGLGLFFTFGGLVLALYFASEGVAAKDVEQAQAALKHLLDAATFKFLTSLAGLASSLLFSYREKHKLHLMAGQIELLSAELEASLERRSLEKMAHQRTLAMRAHEALLKEHLDEARQQTAQIKRFETDFAVSIASALDNRLSPRFEYLAATLSVAIENLGLKIGTVNEEALQTMIGDFRKTLTEGTSSEIAKMAELVEQLTSRLENSGTQLEEKLTGAGQEMSATFARISQELLSSGDGFKGVLQGAGQEMTQAFNNISSGLVSSGNDLQGMLRDAGTEMANNLLASGDGFKDVLQGAGQEMTDVFNSISNDLKTSGSDLQGMLRNAGEEMTATFGRISENLILTGQVLTNNMQKAGEEISSGARALEGALFNLKADLVDLDDVVKNATDSAKETATLLSKNVTDLSALHESLGYTLMGLQSVGASIENTTLSLSSAISGMTEAQQITSAQSKQLLEAAHAALGSIQSSGQSITSVTAALQGAWEAYQARFEGVDADMERVFSQLQMGLEQYSDKVKEFQSSLDKHLSTALVSLASIVHELNESVEELQEASA